ncbi:unnamed protein product [Prunus armeniaca]|uniref:Uncharacterized protein n=1 Tax=Prunus armeniaca TaxID=36596 RepID=A0A6J5UNW0_PRUAR|nr:unnamed protein product [Prunus armeniaca]
MELGSLLVCPFILCLGPPEVSWLRYGGLGVNHSWAFEPGAGHLNIPQVPKEGGDLGPGYLPIELPIGKGTRKGYLCRFRGAGVEGRQFEGEGLHLVLLNPCRTARVARVPRGVGRAARVLKEAGLLEFFRYVIFEAIFPLLNPCRSARPRHWFLGTRALEKRVPWSWVLSGKAEPLPKGGLRNYIGGAHFLFGKFSLASGAESLEPGVGDLGWSRQGSLQHRGPQSPWCFSSGPLRARFALGPGLFWSRTFRLGDFSKGPESLSSLVKLQGRLSQFFSRAWVRQGLGKV